MKPIRCVVLADGDRPSRAELDGAWPAWDEGVELVIAADGGARLGADLGLRLDAWVGDGDSLDERAATVLREAGIEPHPVSVDKDESDTELALIEAVTRGATDITIVGGLGGARLDHALANVTLLDHPALAGRSARLLGARARVTLLHGDHGPTRVSLSGRIGDLVTLLPFGGSVDGVSTGGLRYPLDRARLDAGRTRGLSNVRTEPVTRLEIATGWLLVVESPATLAP